MTREWVDDMKPHPVDKRWVMRCDRYIDGKRCLTQSEPSVKQPPLESFIDLGWFIAEKHGDICPSCLATGYRPTVKPRRARTTPVAVVTAPVQAPSGSEGPTPGYHRCRTCRQPVETYRPTGTPRMLRAKRHGGMWGSQCTGSYGPVDVDAELYGGAR